MLVHCLAGVSRSASVVVAYIMARQHVPLKDAYECVPCQPMHAVTGRRFVKSRRAMVSPNLGFVGQVRRCCAWHAAQRLQLQRYEQQLFPFAARSVLDVASP